MKTQEQVELLAHLREVGMKISRGVLRANERKRGREKRNRQGGESLVELWNKRSQARLAKLESQKGGETRWTSMRFQS